MSTYHSIFYHIVFATKYRQPSINRNHDVELYKYIQGVIKNKRSTVYCINGIEDHIHIMSAIHPAISLSNFVKDIKVASCTWLKTNANFPLFNGWQDGYGAFTYSIREKHMIVNYIKNQKEHHKAENSTCEFIRLLIENGIAFDEKFLL
ncbi:MAG: IS200/IS605 family transposase [Chitinophagaceae bacterium]